MSSTATAASGIVAHYALHAPGLLLQRQQQHHGRPSAQAHAGQQSGATRPPVDLMLVASASLAARGGLIAEAAQLLLTVLLAPAPWGTYPPPVSPLHDNLPRPAMQQQQQQQQQGGGAALPSRDNAVFTAPGSAAAASRWPPAALSLALQHAAPGGLVLDRLPSWLPALHLACVAAQAHPHELPVEVLSATAVGLLCALQAAAPGAPSCAAAGWICRLLRSGHWDVWKPLLGEPAQLIQRCVPCNYCAAEAAQAQLAVGTNCSVHCTALPCPALARLCIAVQLRA
jgi:hypothetical protein